MRTARVVAARANAGAAATHDALLAAVGEEARAMTRRGYRLLGEPGRYLVADARVLLTRVTYDRSPTGLAVYGRHNKPCLRCGDTIAVARHGEHARATFWCPGCQVRLGPPTVELPDAPRRSDRWFGPAATVGR